MECEQVLLQHGMNIQKATPITACGPVFNSYSMWQYNIIVSFRVSFIYMERWNRLNERSVSCVCLTVFWQNRGETVVQSAYTISRTVLKCSFGEDLLFLPFTSGKKCTVITRDNESPLCRNGLA